MLGEPTSQAGRTPDSVPVTGTQAVLTVASSSNLPKSSFSSFTSSWAVHWDAKPVKPTMSAKRMLQETQCPALHLTRHAPAQPSYRPWSHLNTNLPVIPRPRLEAKALSFPLYRLGEATGFSWSHRDDMLQPPRAPADPSQDTGGSSTSTRPAPFPG